ncbi:MAG: DUF4258 domain-containing protein [Planctomycetaceae bacterium]|nr:DUF4258 domain-containing protein [Planctomycetaceae bacterium]
MKHGNGDGPDVTVPTAAGGRIIHLSILGVNVLELTKHAIDQMRIREVKEDEVIRVIRGPQVKNLATQGNRERVRRFRGTKRAVDVVFERLPDRIRVITVIVISLP